MQNFRQILLFALPTIRSAAQRAISGGHLERRVMNEFRILVIVAGTLWIIGALFYIPLLIGAPVGTVAIVIFGNLIAKRVERQGNAKSEARAMAIYQVAFSYSLLWAFLWCAMVLLIRYP